MDARFREIDGGTDHVRPRHVIPPDKMRLARRCEFFDPGKAVRELGLPQTPVRVALRKAVEWYRSHGYAA